MFPLLGVFRVAHNSRENDLKLETGNIAARLKINNCINTWCIQ